MNKIRFFVEIIVSLIGLIFLTFGVLLFVYLKNLEVLIYLTIAHYLTNSIFAYIILTSNKISYSKNCWLLVINIFPFIGITIFCLFGLNIIKKKAKKEYINNQDNLLKYEDFTYSLDYLNKKENKYTNLFQYGFHHLKKPIYCNNEIEIISDPTLLLEKIVKIIQKAKYSINIQSFIFRSDGFFTKILFFELIKKAIDGVKIRILYDFLGTTIRTKRGFFNLIRKYGIEVASFNPIYLNIFTSSINYRLHSKFIIVDNEIGLYGGSNFGDEYLSMSKSSCLWNDFNTIVKGPIINTMNESFLNYWLTFGFNPKNKNTNQNLKKNIPLLLRNNSKQKNKKNALMQLLCFNPQIDELGLNEFLLNTFINAKKAIKIVTPYFCPSKEINNCLIFLFKKGIKIEIVVPSKNAHFIKIMNQHCYKNLVDLGIKIYEYDGFIHSKLILIDQEYALIGSCNLDYRSIYFDFESELIVIDNEFILQATKIFTQYKDNSTLIEKKNLKQKERICKKLLVKTMSLGKTLF